MLQTDKRTEGGGEGGLYSSCLISVLNLNLYNCYFNALMS